MYLCAAADGGGTCFFLFGNTVDNHEIMHVFNPENVIKTFNKL